MQRQDYTLLFDLDGTLTDPKEGITRSINYALSQHGYPKCDVDELAKLCIGPPLHKTFPALIKDNAPELINALIDSYRERYIKTGYAENTIYDGIAEILKHIEDRKIMMAVCTSKPSHIAQKILHKFDIAKYFEFVSGGENVEHKGQQIEALLHKKKISKNSIMIGDRAVDIIAAKQNNMRSAGVLWGYGSREELSSENPDFLFKTVDALEKLYTNRV